MIKKEKKNLYPNPFNFHLVSFD